MRARGIYRGLGFEEDELAADFWLDSKWTRCAELEPDGETGVILVDRREG